MKPGLTPRAPSDPVRVVIADDHDLARAGLRSMLARERDVEIVGEAVNGQEAVSLCRRLQPDLLLTDVRMPELDGLAVTRAIKERQPQISVIIVTMHEDPEYLFEALKAGAAGYLLKGASHREIVTAVRQVARGEMLLQPELTTRLLHRLAGEAKVQAEAPRAELTAREREVLQLLATGQTNREIARQLVVSPGTVKTHIEHIIRKLDVSDRTQAAVRGIQLGLVSS